MHLLPAVRHLLPFRRDLPPRDEVETPFKCNLCNGSPRCVEACPRKALLYLPDHVLGQAQRMASVLKYGHMKEVEYVEKGERKVLRYADIEKGKTED